MATKKPNKIRVVSKKGQHALEPYAKNDYLTPNTSQPTLFADIVNVLIRLDDIGVISFYSKASGVNIETCRVAMSIETLKKAAALIEEGIQKIDKLKKEK